MQTQARIVTIDDEYLFARGEWYESYEKMGAHPAGDSPAAGYRFAVWAPGVRSVHVVGDFNQWDDSACPLECRGASGIWTGADVSARSGDLYKYVIEAADGSRTLKADPYAFFAEYRPGTASRLYDIEGFQWNDALWMLDRAQADHRHRPLNIYEVHLGSWRRHSDRLDEAGEPTYCSYDELSVDLVRYVADMGYTHIELLPVAEHPFDGSWGYQTTGFFAPTSRFGDPHQFMRFVDACHAAGLGVILDWVPGHFCKDVQGLARFNGQRLFESVDHPQWGTSKFDFSRPEVCSFLVSNALFWIEKYHIDGIRVDGVTSMLYLNFGIENASDMRFNEDGSQEDRAAIEFLRKVNGVLGIYHADVMTIAEESSAWPLVTYPPSDGGLGFHFKWDMGWMNDTLRYMATDFPYRSSVHNLLTFSTMYQFNENFILPLSHDEVVHGKRSLIGRMPGDNWRQFAGMRALALYQMTHAGGKLSFMGNEIAQFIEWRYYEGIEFFLCDRFETHRTYRAFVRALNRLYREQPALWRLGFEAAGFEWIDADNAGQSTIAYARKSDEWADELLVVINFGVDAYVDWRLGTPSAGSWRELLNSDEVRFGGSGVVNEGELVTQQVPSHGRAQSLLVRVPPLGGMVLARMVEE